MANKAPSSVGLMNPTPAEAGGPLLGQVLSNVHGLALSVTAVLSLSHNAPVG